MKPTLRPALILAALALALGSGCDRQPPATPPPVVTAAPGVKPAQSQLEAALAIAHPIKRDEALNGVARTAAEAGDGGMTTTAVVAIANPILKDETAAAAAKKLAGAGNGAAATALAKTIANPIKRDEVLLDLSKR